MTIIIWAHFYSNIKATPQELGLDLGENNHLSILDTPFNLFSSNYLDIDQIYIVILNKQEALLKSKMPNSVTGISQIVAFLDTTLTLTEEKDLSGPFFSKFQIGEKIFTELTIEAIKAIKCTQEVKLYVNTPSFDTSTLSHQQIIFHKPTEEPAYGEHYARKCRNLLAWLENKNN